GRCGCIIFFALPAFFLRVVRNRNKRPAVDAWERLARNVAKSRFCVSGNKIVGHLLMRAVRVGIPDKKEKWFIRGVLACVVVLQEANRLLGKKWRLESVRCDVFPVVGEVLPSRMWILAHPVTEPGVESRMGIPFFSTMPFTNQTGMIARLFQQL